MPFAHRNVAAETPIADLVFADDPHQMNWLRPDFGYAEVRLPQGDPGGWPRPPAPLEATVETSRTGDELRTVVTIRNTGDRPYFARHGEISITLPLEDRYDAGERQLTHRCNVHLCCAGTSSWAVALRMGGEAPHLGLVLSEGALASYSIERNIDHMSNDRGCFLLNPAPFELQPGETTRTAWSIFPFNDMKDFFAKAGERTRLVRADWDRYVLFRGERAGLTIAPSFEAAAVRVNGVPVARDDDGRYRVRFDAVELGEHTFDIDADGATLRTRLLVKVPLAELIERRCRFIAVHQQYRGANDGLRGAYLTYDNEDNHLVYDSVHDFNAGRERVGMGVLLARYLLALRDGVLVAEHPDTQQVVSESLAEFAAFMSRELVDESTGEAFNDVGRDGGYQRLYNAPWYAQFFVLRWRLDSDTAHLGTAIRLLERFYADGGRNFYPLELPIVELCAALETAGMSAERERAIALFADHAARLVEIGTNYPPSEVNYEQSIVAPAVEILLQTALVTGDATLRDAAAPHIRALEQFQGMQPDSHLNEVAIRHWDGYWFGKRAQYGDTLPHYWSGLTGNAFATLHRVTGDARYAARANASLRAVLPTIFDDGRASAAFVLPHRVNGERTIGWDPLANDQDWALVFALRQVSSNPDAPL
ncbi:MAG TPA: hypothetical protein VFU07_07535 [Candidatus Lumbricidophila sp.]|nr:hypothetical protein [Candidatus Lumbricidophila sp.]